MDIVVTTTAPGTFTNTAWDILNNRQDMQDTLRPYIPGRDPVIDEAVRNSQLGLN